MGTNNLCFEQKYEKYQHFSVENFQFLKLKKISVIAWASFRNVDSLFFILPKYGIFNPWSSFWLTVGMSFGVTSGKHVRAMYTPFEPHVYIEKLGFAGYTNFFLFLLQNIDCGYQQFVF